MTDSPFESTEVANLRWVGKARHEDRCKFDRSDWIVSRAGELSARHARKPAHRAGRDFANSVRDFSSCRSQDIKASPPFGALCVQLQVTRPRERGLRRLGGFCQEMAGAI